jgi:hypothetical protein
MAPAPLQIAGVLAAGAFVVTGCGASSAPTKIENGRITPQTMGREAAAPGSANGTTPVSGATRVGHRTRAGADHDPTAIPMRDPCSLVRHADVEAATQSTIARVTVAPLGPTCIYQFAGSRPEITLALDSTPSPTVIATGTVRVRIGRSHGYCETLGRQRLLVSLPHGRTLAVTASCTVAVSLARAAMARLQPGA